jgi:tripartite-type tricarboxylate transporter receptor subunit TctC
LIYDYFQKIFLFVDSLFCCQFCFGFACPGALSVKDDFDRRPSSTWWRQRCDATPACSAIDRHSKPASCGTVFVARSKSDGYTLLFNQTSHVINPSLYSKAGYDNARDFIPIASVADGAFLLVSSVKSDIKSVEDLVTRAKRRPGEIRYGSAGNGTVNHLAGAMLEKTANIDLLHVPYKGGAESGLGLAAGDVDISFQAPASALPFVQRGQIRVIAQTNPQRQSSYPSTPTVGEILRGYGVTPWYGLFAPKGTPDAVVHTINVAVNKALASKEFQDKLLAIGLTPTPRSQIEFARWVAEESEKWQRVVKESGATID